MKKLCLIFAILFAMSLAACGATEESVEATVLTTAPVTETASTLCVENLTSSESGSIYDYQVSGTIASNYALTKMECHGTAKSLALNATVNDTPDPFIFPQTVTSTIWQV